jgi:formamidopyrimidine-DNA glycosylase
MLRGRRSAIKQALMDASVVVGVGNIYANEALFMAGIHPEARCDRVGLPRLQTLVECVRRVLRASIRSGGTTLRDFLNDKGEPGYFKQSLRVYDREGQPCRRCEGGVVTRKVQGQRATYFCPRCQRR